MRYQLIIALCLGGMLGIVPATSSQAASGGEKQVDGYRLDEVLQIALERNPRMDEGKGIIEESQGQQQTAQAYPNPELDLLLGRSEFRDSDVRIVTVERFVTVSQPLEWRPKRVARKQAADAGVESARAALEETKVNLTSEVKEAFYTVLFAEKRAKLAAKNLSIVEGLSRAVKSRVRAGEAPPFEEVRVNVELLKVSKEVARAKGAVRTSRASLNALTGNALGTEFSVTGEFARWPQGIELTSLKETALQRHPTLKKLQKFVDQAAHTHIQEREGVVPNVTVSGSYQRDAGREAYLGGLTVPLPFWYQRQGEIAKALATQRQIEGQLIGMQNAIVREVTQSFQFSLTAAGQIATYEEGLLKQAREAVRIAQVSFKFGEANLLQVIDAQRVFWDTLIGYAQARLDLSVSLTQLERSVGTVPWLKTGA